MAQSLKDKRRQIKSLKDRLSSKFNLSVSEVGELEQWQRADLAICMVSNERNYLEKQASAIDQLLLDYAELELIDSRREWL